MDEFCPRAPNLFALRNFARRVAESPCMWIHLVAHAEPGRRPFASRENADLGFRVLRHHWPCALATCVMPNHLHVLTETMDPDDERARLSHVLGGLSQRWESPRAWTPVPPAQIIPDASHLLRQIRYVHLNPCRGKLVDDPLCYRWSTHRGVIGAELDPWVTPARLASIFNEPVQGFESRFHAYISGDPSVAVAGTLFPKPVPATLVPSYPLDAVLRAVTAATPWSKPLERERLAVVFAINQGWSNVAQLAHAIGISERSVRRHAARNHDARALRAPALCLGDPRLVHQVPQIWPKSGQIRSPCRQVG